MFKNKKPEIAKLVLILFSGLAFSLSMASPVQAAGHWNPVKVQQVGVNSSGTAFIKVHTNTSQANSTPPACSINGFWQVAFDAKSDAGKAILSMAMSAKISGQYIRLIGSNVCTTYASIEDVYVIDLVPGI
ncbi:MAG: hypothetical protein ABJN65_00975 [Parasphingorhabdus sp.]